jgi:hypothetical protein
MLGLAGRAPTQAGHRAPPTNDGLSSHRRSSWGRLFVRMGRQRGFAAQSSETTKHASAVPHAPVNIAHLSKINPDLVQETEYPGDLTAALPGGSARHFDGLVRHRMPLRRELKPLLFRRPIGRALGLPLASDRVQTISLRQFRLGDALKDRHSTAL